MIVSIEHRFYLLLCEALLLYPDNFCVGVQVVSTVTHIVSTNTINIHQTLYYSLATSAVSRLILFTYIHVHHHMMINHRESHTIQ